MDVNKNKCNQNAIKVGRTERLTIRIREDLKEWLTKKDESAGDLIERLIEKEKKAPS